VSGKVKPALVVGAGIAGIQAAVDLAEQGIKTYLVERTPSIGGRMAQLDKTFPTLDCASCILTPKMVSVAKNNNIELLTYAEVQEIKGNAGNFTVKVLKKPRYVEVEKCLGCGECITKCPMSVPDEFNLGMSNRGAIYWPFPQAVPLIATIDAEHCFYFTRDKKCRICEKICPTEAINFKQEPATVELNVASIIITTGFQLQDPTQVPTYGYGKYANVRTSLEFERLVSATGPTAGQILRGYGPGPSDPRHVLLDRTYPKSIAFIQCVCSRDVRMNPNCSAFCCTASVKQAILAKEHLPKVDCTVFYMDLRAYGKGYQEFYNRAMGEFGVEFVRARPAKIDEVAETKNLVVTYEDTYSRRLVKREFEMVVLALGVKMNAVTAFIDLPLDEDGYVKLSGSCMDPVSTNVDGVFAAGVAAGAKDIPDSVTQASAAAMRASILAANGGE
jgi:heterodisulfide reductase subunit A